MYIKVGGFNIDIEDYLTHGKEYIYHSVWKMEGGSGEWYNMR